MRYNDFIGSAAAHKILFSFTTHLHGRTRRFLPPFRFKRTRHVVSMPTLCVISAHQAVDGVVQPQLCYRSDRPAFYFAWSYPCCSGRSPQWQKATAQPCCSGRSPQWQKATAQQTLHASSPRSVARRGGKSRRLYSVPFLTPNTFEDP